MALNILSHKDKATIALLGDKNVKKLIANFQDRSNPIDYREFGICDKISELATSKIQNEINSIFYEPYIDNLSIILSFGTADALDNVNLEDYQKELTHFSWKLSNEKVAWQANNLNKAFTIIYLKPSITENLPLSFQYQLAKYVGITYYTLISNFPSLILASQDNLDSLKDLMNYPVISTPLATPKNQESRKPNMHEKQKFDFQIKNKDYIKNVGNSKNKLEQSIEREIPKINVISPTISELESNMSRTVTELDHQSSSIFIEQEEKISLPENEIERTEKIIDLDLNPNLQTAGTSKILEIIRDDTKDETNQIANKIYKREATKLKLDEMNSTAANKPPQHFQEAHSDANFKNAQEPDQPTDFIPLALYINLYNFEKPLDKILIRSGNRIVPLIPEKSSTNPNLLDPIRLIVTHDLLKDAANQLNKLTVYDGAKNFLTEFSITDLVQQDQNIKNNKKDSWQGMIINIKNFRNVSITNSGLVPKIKINPIIGADILNEISFKIKMIYTKLPSNKIPNKTNISNLNPNKKFYLTISVPDQIINQFTTIFRSELVQFFQNSNNHQNNDKLKFSGDYIQEVNFQPFNIHQRRIPKNSAILIKVKMYGLNAADDKTISLLQVENIDQLLTSAKPVLKPNILQKYPEFTIHVDECTSRKF